MWNKIATALGALFLLLPWAAFPQTFVPAFASMEYTSNGDGTTSPGVYPVPPFGFAPISGAGNFNRTLAGPNTSIDVANGRITVSLAGTYLITFHGQVTDYYYTANQVRIQLTKSGVAVGDAYAALENGDRGSCGTFSGSMAISASAGDFFFLSIASDLGFEDALGFSNLSFSVLRVG